MPSIGKSSHGLWPGELTGELKKKRNKKQLFELSTNGCWFIVSL
jgi:hypothetical protein